MTLDCVDLTQSSVIRIIHRNVGVKCLLLSLVFSYMYILQGSVEMRSWYGGMYNNLIIANCLRSVLYQCKNF